ncbi:MAG TPA: DNA polymerase III subunit beta [Patescibacteria group bacterium]|nr:DNA polymerase III subunit beta [Patescibacteria group bacterium]
MKITVLTENLLPIIQEAQRFISTRPQLPIFSGISLQTTSEGLYIRTTDMKTGYQSRVGGKVERKGETVVVGKPFVDFLSTLTVGPAEITLLDTQMLEVKQKRSTAKFQTFPFDDFPPFANIPEKQTEIEKETFLQLVQKTSYAAGIDEARPVLTALHLEFSEGSIIGVCTDGYRLAIQERQVKNQEGKLEKILVQAKTLTEFARGLSRSKEKKVLLGTSSELQEAFFSVGETTLFLRLIEGKFPDYNAIIPENFAFKIQLQCGELLSAIKTATIFARESSSIVTLRFVKGECFVEAASSGLGENSTSLECDYEGSEEMKISFNSRFLSDALSHIDGEVALLSVNDSLKPMIIREAGKEDLHSLHVVMPFKK